MITESSANGIATHTAQFHSFLQQSLTFVQALPQLQPLCELQWFRRQLLHHLFLRSSLFMLHPLLTAQTLFLQLLTSLLFLLVRVSFLLRPSSLTSRPEGSMTVLPDQ